MKHLIAIKLKSQDIDLIAYQSGDDEYHITVERPVQVRLEPNQGFYAVDWMYLSSKKVVSINKKDILYYTQPSDRAQSIYDDFWEASDRNDNDEIDSDELLTLFESRMSTKH